MSYALAGALQSAVYDSLITSVPVTDILGDAIYDAPPQGNALDLPDTHAVIGEERVKDASTMTSVGAVHEFSVIVHTTLDGFAKAKEAAAAICDTLDDAALTLSRGSLINLQFLSARADRNTARRPRRVVLRFRAFVEDTA